MFKIFHKNKEEKELATAASSDETDIDNAQKVIYVWYDANDIRGCYDFYFSTAEKAVQTIREETLKNGCVVVSETYGGEKNGGPLWIEIVCMSLDNGYSWTEYIDQRSLN